MSEYDGQPRCPYRKIGRTLKVVAAGASGASAAAFSIFDDETHHWCTINFGIFVTSLFLFNVLHIQDWKLYGLYACPLAFFLILFLLALGLDKDSYSKKLYPLCIFAFCMVPPAIGSWKKRANGVGGSLLPIPTGYAGGSSRAASIPSTRGSSWRNLYMGSYEPNFGFMSGPMSQAPSGRSNSSGSGESGILRNVRPQARPGWKPVVQRFFSEQPQEPEGDAHVPMGLPDAPENERISTESINLLSFHSV